MIVVAGESLIDLVVAPSGTVTAIPGGGPFNVARTIARLGRPASFIGRLSTDAFGRRLRAQLEADGVDLSMAPTTDDPTLLAVAEIGADGSATYRFHTAGTAAAGLAVADVEAGLPPGAVAVHVGTLGIVLEPMADAIERLVAGVGPGVVVMVDPNCRPAAIRDMPGWRARLGRILGRADVVKVSVDDLAVLEPGREPQSAARALLALGPAVVLVTDGGRPVRIVTAAAVRDVPVPMITVVDTIGAGDAFCGGFLAAWTGAGHARDELADPEALVAATVFGVAVAAWTVGRPGAEPPTRSDLRGAAPDW